MKLTSGYAPTTFLRPCLVVDTEFTSACRETGLIFVDALNVYHAYAFAGDHAPKSTGWIVIAEHETEEDAIRYHLDLVRSFKNGATDEEWEEGMPRYLEFYEQHCPANFR